MKLRGVAWRAGLCPIHVFVDDVIVSAPIELGSAMSKIGLLNLRKILLLMCCPIEEVKLTAHSKAHPGGLPIADLQVLPPAIIGRGAVFVLKGFAG
jgi:hypothetical protein